MIKKYNYIELLRFVSAFSVLMAHYMHFFNPFNGFSEIEIFSGYLEFNKEFLPFYSVIENFYKFGHMGVYFFWELSGFVLAYAYLNTLRYKIKFKEFFVNRFARLYPLHLITLIILIFLQFLLIKNFGQQQITDNSFYSGINNLKNFFYHIFFISGWFDESKITYNFPIWSVSIEILIYFLFFYLLRFLFKFKLFLSFLIFILFTYLSKSEFNFFFIDCGRYFFSGVFVYFVCEKIQKSYLLVILSILLMILSFMGNFKYNLFFSSIIFLAAFLEIIDKSKFKNYFSFLGNLTYSSYLLHMPLQLLIILLSGYFTIDQSIFTTNHFFIVYLSLIFFISHLSYKYIENPLRLLIKKI